MVRNAVKGEEQVRVGHRRAFVPPINFIVWKLDVFGALRVFDERLKFFVYSWGMIGDARRG